MNITALIEQAMAQHVFLEIRYVDKHGKETVRLVRPDSIKGSVLFAYCMTRQAERVFILSRIQAVNLTDQSAPAVEETEPDHDEDTFDLDALLEDIPKPREGVSDTDVEDFVRTVKWCTYVDHI